MADENKKIQGEPKRKLYAYRYLARIILQAETPLAVGSGKNNILTDAMVMRDVNGLPFIPGTSIAGVLRHAVDEINADYVNEIFGFQGKENDGGLGSRLICTSARMIGKDGSVLDGLQNVDFNVEFYSAFKNLPIRQHVRINDKGAAGDGGKFDEEVVYKGTRFCFDIELFGEDEKDVIFFKEELLPRMRQHTFRLGGGTRGGFGEMSILSYQCRTINLADGDDLKAYLQKSSSLNGEFQWDCDDKLTDQKITDGWTTYTMTLTPEDFFLFGSGFGDGDADMTPVREKVVTWNSNGKGQLSKQYYLLPASSIKGAIAHRVAYHYNRLTGIFADDFINDRKNKEGKTMSDYVGANNTAVRLLFGSEGKGDTKKIRGNVIFSDLYIEASGAQDKILNHVAIDRFTGGAIDGALFSEKTVYGKGTHLKMELLVNETGVKKMAENDTVYTNIMSALSAALNDLRNGMLPLGGGVNRGNGIFTGSLMKN